MFQELCYSRICANYWIAFCLFSIVDFDAPWKGLWVILSAFQCVTTCSVPLSTLGTPVVFILQMRNGHGIIGGREDTRYEEGWLAWPVR